MDVKSITRILRSIEERNEFSEAIRSLEAMQEISNDNRFRITNAGPMNPGKSTFFNALLRKREVFKTSDARQTAVCQEEPWGQLFTLIDTPGCNSVVSQDFKESEIAFRKADFITFVHNISTGGLQKSELDILKGIQASFGKKDFAQRVCIVCNRIDDVPDEETIERNKSEILTQIKNNLKVDLKLYCVSPLYYLEGIDYEIKNEKDDAKFFYDSSNMAVLIKAINDAYTNLGKRRSFDFADLLKKLKTTYSNQCTRLEEFEFELLEEQTEVREKWEGALDNIRSAWNECARVEEFEPVLLQGQTEVHDVFKFFHHF